jgi:hypothetical protein
MKKLSVVQALPKEHVRDTGLKNEAESNAHLILFANGVRIFDEFVDDSFALSQNDRLLDSVVPLIRLIPVSDRCDQLRILQAGRPHNMDLRHAVPLVVLDLVKDFC